MAPTETRSELIARLAYTYKMKAQAADAMKAEADEAMAELVPLLPEDGKKLTDLFYEGKNINVTRVQGSSSWIDETNFGKSLSTRVWNAVSRRVLAQDKLEVAIKDGLVDPKLVEQHTKTSFNKAYARITIKGA